jgi:hypothetical protein
MKAMEIISGFATAPSTTFTGITVCDGNSLTLRNAVEGSLIRLLAIWATHQTAGNVRLRSPQLHDNVQGIRLFDPADNPMDLLPMQINQQLESQDTLTLELTGSATGGDLEMCSILVYYEDLPGINGRFAMPQDIFDRTVDLMVVENTLALGTTGQYTGQEAINAEFDQFKANTDYALLGYLVSAQCNCVRWQGADIGNLGIGGPGNAVKKDSTRDWFIDLSNKSGLPCVPIFNSANKFSILVDGQQDEDGTDTTVSSIFAELKMA